MTNLQKTAQPAKADQIERYLRAARTRLRARQQGNTTLSEEAGRLMQHLQQTIRDHGRQLH